MTGTIKVEGMTGKCKMNRDLDMTRLTGPAPLVPDDGEAVEPGSSRALADPGTTPGFAQRGLIGHNALQPSDGRPREPQTMRRLAALSRVQVHAYPETLCYAAAR